VVIEQSVAAADTVTPGTTFGSITLPPVDITRSHAEEHAEFPIVRQCYENPNNIMMYRERHNAAYKWMYHILLQSKQDGNWYDRLIYKSRTYVRGDRLHAERRLLGSGLKVAAEKELSASGGFPSPLHSPKIREADYAPPLFRLAH